MSLEEANKKRKQTAYKNRKVLYKLIKQHPDGITVYNASTLIGWDVAKVSYYVEQLENRGIVKTKRVKKGDRIVKVVFPVDVRNLVKRLKKDKPELLEPAIGRLDSFDF